MLRIVAGAFKCLRCLMSLIRAARVDHDVGLAVMAGYAQLQGVSSFGRTGSNCHQALGV